MTVVVGVYRGERLEQIEPHTLFDVLLERSGQTRSAAEHLCDRGRGSNRALGESSWRDQPSFVGPMGIQGDRVGGPSIALTACVVDNETTVDADSSYTVVLSSPSDRLANTTSRCSIGWLRSDSGSALLITRIILRASIFPGIGPER
ncbi:hypothetical protein ACFZC5_36435 [Nocardia gamkensis]|uniref:hypothetical protein n=1 Tax=Nocardia gamkensis TaxID=352869 RepID=UPI0036E85387